MRRLIPMFGTLAALAACGPPPARTSVKPVPCDGSEFLIVNNNGTEEANISVDGMLIGVVGTGRSEFRLLPTTRGLRYMFAAPAVRPNQRQAPGTVNVRFEVECRKTGAD